jgi:hypothetical protein
MLSIKQKYLFLLLGNFLILLLFYTIGIKPLQHIINNKQQQNYQIDTAINQRNLAKNNTILTTTTITKPTISIANILNTLELCANKTQTIIQTIEKYSCQADCLWDIYQIELTVAGQYQSIINFINTIMQHYCLTTFDEFELQKITASPLEDEFTLNTTIIIYQLSPRGAERQIPHEQLSNYFITTPKDFIKNRGNLSLWSLSELQFIGSIKQQHKIIGFVTDPMGETHQVTIGDKIGLQQALITNINESGIITNAQKIN